MGREQLRRRKSRKMRRLQLEEQEEATPAPAS